MNVFEHFLSVVVRGVNCCAFKLVCTYDACWLLDCLCTERRSSASARSLLDSISIHVKGRQALKYKGETH